MKVILGKREEWWEGVLLFAVVVLFGLVWFSLPYFYFIGNKLK